MLPTKRIEAKDTCVFKRTGRRTVETGSGRFITDLGFIFGQSKKREVIEANVGVWGWAISCTLVMADTK